MTQRLSGSAVSLGLSDSELEAAVETSSGDALEFASQFGVLDLYAAPENVRLASLWEPETASVVENSQAFVYPSLDVQVSRLAGSAIPVPIPADLLKGYVYRSLAAEGLSPDYIASRLNSTFNDPNYARLDNGLRTAATQFVQRGGDSAALSRTFERISEPTRRYQYDVSESIRSLGPLRVTDRSQTVSVDLTAYRVHCPNVTGAKATFSLSSTYEAKAALTFSILGAGGELMTGWSIGDDLDTTTEDGVCVEEVFTFNATVLVLQRFTPGNEPMGHPFHRLELREETARRNQRLAKDHDACLRFASLDGVPKEWSTEAAAAGRGGDVETMDAVHERLAIPLPKVGRPLEISNQVKASARRSYRVSLPRGAKCYHKPIPGELCPAFNV